MKLTTYRRLTPLGITDRAALYFNETTLVDLNFVWTVVFQEKGFFQPELRAQHHCPTSLSSIMKIYQKDTLNFLKETLDHFIRLSTKGILKTLNHASLSFDLQDDKSVSITKPISEIHCYRDYFTHEKHVKTGFKKRGEEIPPAWYEIPAYYKGATTNFIGPNDIITWPSYSQKLDYELEFALILCADGKNISEKNVAEHVLGFTILNDISARDIQKKEMSIRLGPSKAKDFCSVIGPVIVTRDEFSDLNPQCKMSAMVNDELWSQGLTSDAHYTWEEMLAFTSKDEWLLSTDLFGSGTVGTGCGLELDRWIQPGDVIELEIEKIGKLRNIVGTPEKGESFGKF